MKINHIIVIHIIVIVLMVIPLGIASSKHITPDEKAPSLESTGAPSEYKSATIAEKRDWLSKQGYSPEMTAALASGSQDVWLDKLTGKYLGAGEITPEMMDNNKRYEYSNIASDTTKNNIFNEGFLKLADSLKINESDPVYWYNEGDALLNASKYNESIEAYDKAIELNQSYVEAWYNKGVALKALNRINEANAAFARAKELGFTA